MSFVPNDTVLELNEYTYKLCMTAIQRIPFQKTDKEQEAIMVTVWPKISNPKIVFDDYCFQIWRVDDMEDRYQLNNGVMSNDPFELYNLSVLKKKYFTGNHYITLADRVNPVNPEKYLTSEEIRKLKEECGILINNQNTENEKTNESSSTRTVVRVPSSFEELFAQKVKSFNPEIDDIIEKSDVTLINLFQANLPLSNFGYYCIFKSRLYLFTIEKSLNVSTAKIISLNQQYLIIETEYGVCVGQYIGDSNKNDTNAEILGSITKNIDMMTDDEFTKFSSNQESYINVAKVNGYSLLKKMYDRMVKTDNFILMPGIVTGRCVLFFQVLLKNYIDGIHKKKSHKFILLWLNEYVMNEEQKEECKDMVKEVIRLLVQSKSFDMNTMIDLAGLLK